MPVHVLSGCLRGVDGVVVDVEVDVLNQLPCFQVVGLPNNSVRESRERVRSAIESSGLPFPRRRIVANLAPADLPKHGTGLDLPIALAVVAAAQFLELGDPAWQAPPWAIGELGLDGVVRPVRGVLPLVEAAARARAGAVMVPRENAAEARLVPGVRVLAVDSLSGAWELAAGLRDDADASAAGAPDHGPPGERGRPAPEPDLKEIRGLTMGRRAVELAAAGGHGLLLEGPPGAGKSMLARRLPGILPDLLPDEALEVMRIQSAAGLLALPGGTAVLRTRPPLRAPHHTASAVAVIGGGRPLGPGEVTLAHRGVLLLDEAPEFPRSLLETLRQPLEDGVVTVARAEAVIRFPSVFQLVATRNPCPCGMLGSEDRACMCSAAEREAYQRRISGPLLDRVDLLAWVDPVRPGELLSGDAGEPSSTVKARVERARGAQLERWSASGARSALNAHAGLQDCLAAFSAAGRRELEAALAHVRGSARSVQQLARVAVSVADLEGDPRVAPGHVQEALLFCGGSRDGAGPVRLQASARQSRRAARGDEPRPHNGAEAPGT